MNCIPGKVVVKAFEEINLQPIQHMWGIHEKCGGVCGLSAVFIQKEGIEKFRSYAESVALFSLGLETALNVTSHYIDGYVDGFDGNYKVMLPDTPEDYDKGYEDGKEAMTLLFAAEENGNETDS